MEKYEHGGMHTGGGRPESTAAPGRDTVGVAATDVLVVNLAKSCKVKSYYNVRADHEREQNGQCVSYPYGVAGTPCS